MEARGASFVLIRALEYSDVLSLGPLKKLKKKDSQTHLIRGTLHDVWMFH